MAQILVVGSLNMDLVAVAPRIPASGETIMGSDYFSTPGGKGANQAYAAAKLGGHVAMLGRVGNDDLGRRMVANLQEAGCDTSGVGTEDGPSGVALIFVGEKGQNSIVVVPGANAKFRFEHVSESANLFPGVKVVLLQLETPIATISAAAQMARSAGARVILDPAPAPNSPLSGELLRAVHILTPNESEAAILIGEKPGALRPLQAVAISRKLRQFGVETVIIKLGDQGCVLVNMTTAILVPAPIVKAIDTTAAGDVFNAGLAVGLSDGLDLASACRFANYCAALSTTQMGAQAAVPTRVAVEEFMRNGNAADMVALT